MDGYFMGLALEQAEKARALGEVPVGCVIVKDGAVIGEGYNRRETDKTVLGHAELMAMKQAEAAIGDWRLTDCTLYVTLEPCPMCAGAILNARVGTVVCGATDRTFGACGGVMNLFEEAFGYKPKLYKGVRAEECAAMMTDFFSEMRKK
ncbi:MAG: nucleoside deaminase [Clostridia bacterium]|nr:nucleoside deaminase [Clostridia bacterium]